MLPGIIRGRAENETLSGPMKVGSLAPPLCASHRERQTLSSILPGMPLRSSPFGKGHVYVAITSHTQGKKITAGSG